MMALPCTVFHRPPANVHLPQQGMEGHLHPSSNPLVWAWTSIHPWKPEPSPASPLFLNNNVTSVLSHHCA